MRNILYYKLYFVQHVKSCILRNILLNQLYFAEINHFVFCVTFLSFYCILRSLNFAKYNFWYWFVTQNTTFVKELFTKYTFYGKLLCEIQYALMKEKRRNSIQTSLIWFVKVYWCFFFLLFWGRRTCICGPMLGWVCVTVSVGVWSECVLVWICLSVLVCLSPSVCH